MEMVGWMIVGNMAVITSGKVPTLSLSPTSPSMTPAALTMVSDSGWKWLLMNALRWAEAWASPNTIGICGCGQLILDLFVK